MAMGTPNGKKDHNIIRMQWKTTNGTKRHVRHKCFNSFKSPGSRGKKKLISNQKNLQKGDMTYLYYIYTNLKPKITIFNHGLSVNNFETQI